MQEDFSLKGFVLHAVWLSRVYWLLCICTWDYARWEMHWLQFCGWKVQRRKVPCLEYKKPTNTTWFFNIFNPFVFQLLLILFLKASKVEISPFISIIASVYSSQLKSECKKKKSINFHPRLAVFYSLIFLFWEKCMWNGR